LRKLRAFAKTFAPLLLVAAACSPRVAPVAGGGAGGGSGAGGSGGGAGRDAGSSLDFGFAVPDTAASAEETGEQSCATESQRSERVPLDLLLLVDVSSSMANVVAGGTRSKWDIAHEALTSFLRDPMSSGLNVALHFFPLAASCNLPDYEKAAVPFSELPAGAPGLTAALDAQSPKIRTNFGTPTGVALNGAIAQLRATLAAQPTHRGVILLVTDGEPTACTPVFIDEIAVPVAAAHQGMPSITTYVIGVFTPAELTRARDTVDKLATAGGTMSFLLSAVADLPMKLGQALNQVRNVAVPCEFTIPAPRKGSIDYGKVNLHWKGTTREEDVPYVGSADRCDPVRGGWYYDVDPTAGGTPARVVVCENTCGAFKADPNSAVDLVFGCRTIVIQ
jgi:Mg-chelatase subunit ChlD